MIQKLLAVLILTGLLILSCSGTGNPTFPTLPKESGDNPAHSSTAINAHQLWGYWTVSIDPETMTAEVTPLRGIEFTANVTRFMQPPISPTNMISISLLPGSQPLDGYFEVDVTLRHPFPGLPIYRGFDVRGILIADGSAASEHDASASYGIEGDTLLLNADGLTRWWNPTEFTSYGTLFGYTPGKLAPKVYPDATLNPFKYFADALGHDQYLWELETDSRGTFPTSPGIYTRPYFIQFAMNGGKVDFTFNYAVDASWDLPDPAGAPNYDVSSFPLSANSVEPYCISVVDNGSTAYYEDPDNKGGELNLAVRVYDWQSVTNTNGVKGELSALWLESPVLPAPVDVLSSATVLPDGPTSSIFEVNLSGLDLTKSGDVPLLVFAQAAEDFGYEPQVNGGSNFKFPANPLGAYLMTSVNILDHGNPPVEAPIVLNIDPNHAMYGEALTDVLVGGLYFQTGAQVELRNPDWPAIKATGEVTGAGGTQITCDIDLGLAEPGYWDVVVINPDLLEGVLENGFLVDCADGAHPDETRHFLVDLAISWKYCQRSAMTILETGPYKGQAVLKRSYLVDTVFTSQYVRFDPDNPANAAPVDFFTLPARLPSDTNSNYVTGTSDIDQNHVNGQIAVINGRMFDTIQILDENGVPMPSENIVVTDPLTIPGYFLSITAFDFDANGDLWLVANVSGNPDGYSVEPRWQIRHYVVQPSSPYYVEDQADRVEITGDLINPKTNPTRMWYIADIAISYVENTMFIASATYIGGADFSSKALFAKYDLNQSPPALIETADLLGPIQTIRGLSKCSKLDIEIDHLDLSVETCRIAVLYQAKTSGIYEDHIMKLDTDFNILADNIVLSNSHQWDAPQCIAMNVDENNRNLVSMDMWNAGALNDFFYFPMPSSGW